MPFFKVFWYDSTRGMNPRSTDYEAEALTTTPSRRYKILLGTNMAAKASLQIKKTFIQGQQTNLVLSLRLSVKVSEILMPRFGEHDALV